MKQGVHQKVVDAKEFFKCTRGVLSAHVKPAGTFGALIFNLQQVLEKCEEVLRQDRIATWVDKKIFVVEVQWFVQPE